MNKLEFEEVHEIYNTFLKAFAHKDNETVLKIIIDTFRNFYTPNIEHYLEDSGRNDYKIYIKNSIFKIDIDDSNTFMLLIKRYIFNNYGKHKYIETISFRELLYIYCNPEGKLLVEQIMFQFENVNWEKIEKEKWDELSHRNEDDDIPF